jgi:hypothetical protein
MRRSLLFAAAAAAAAAVAVPALGASSVVNVPDKFGQKVVLVRSDAFMEIRLPETLRAPVRSARVHAAVETSEDGRYRLSLGVGRGCHEATACFVASFRGTRDATLTARRKVDLINDIEGRFDPIRCGASCGPARIQWVENGNRYTILYKGNRRQLRRLANSAIRGGAR